MAITRIDPSTSEPDVTSDSRKFVELIKSVRVAMFTTFPWTTEGVSGEVGGSAHTRPMYTQAIEAPDADSPNRFEGYLWFMTDEASGKTREIADEERVLITYADAGSNIYVAVNGRASLERNPDRAKALWNIHAKGWWPGGPDDPRLVLIRVRVESAEYWSGPSNASYLFNLAKAVLTGERVELKADHARLDPVMRKPAAEFIRNDE